MNDTYPDILLRPATRTDTTFIARCVLAGIEMLHIEEDLPNDMQPVFDHLVMLCQREDTLYSYLNTIIAEVDGETAGALVSYDGSNYAALRKTTFDLVERNTGVHVNQNPMETGAGEYYLDGMAILPPYRGRNIGKRLIQDRIRYAHGSGIEAVTLLVDKDKPRLQAYYESLGFTFKEEVFAFGSWYNKMLSRSDNA